MMNLQLHSGQALSNSTSLIVAVVISSGLLHGCDTQPEVKRENHPQQSLSAPTLEEPPEPAPAAPYAPHPTGQLSFNADIAPLVFQKCAACHHPGEIGPFPLLTYADVQKRASQIVDVTRTRIMPPWPAAPGYCDFQHDRSLTAQEIGMIAQWVDEGAREGNPADLPPLPKFPSGWKYGEPDLVLQMAEVYTLDADVKDTNR